MIELKRSTEIKNKLSYEITQLFWTQVQVINGEKPSDYLVLEQDYMKIIRNTIIHTVEIDERSKLFFPLVRN